MRNARTIVAFAAATLFCLPALAVTSHTTESFYVLEGKHPTGRQQVLVVPVEITEDSYACTGYATDKAKNDSAGYIRTVASVHRVDPDTGEETITKYAKRGNVANAKWLRCVVIGPVNEGDMVVFDYEFRGFPRPKGSRLHVRSTVGLERMLIGELRGPESNLELGDPDQFHQRIETGFAENGRHPKVLTQGFIAHSESLEPGTTDPEGLGVPGPNLFCAAYGNNFTKGDTGRVQFTVEIGRTDPDTEEIVVTRTRKRGNVGKNRVKKCFEIEPVVPGDSVVVEAAFSGFPKLRDNARAALSGDALQLKSSIGPVEMANNEIFGPAPDPPVGPNPNPDPNPNPNPNPDPNPNPNPTPGALSAADQAGFLKLFNTPVASSRQLWRPKGNLYGKWTSINEKTQVNPAFPLNVNGATVGQGKTIAESVANLEQKNGKLPNGTGSMSKALQDCVVAMGNISSAQGSIAIRWGPNGSGWHGEFFHPATGAVGARQPNALAACQWIVKFHPNA